MANKFVMKLSDHEALMRIAIEEALKSKDNNDYPIGAVVTNQKGEILAKSGNRTRIDQDPTKHAEMCAISSACQLIGENDLYGCTLYSTHEPCPICATTALFSHISTVVFGCTIADIMPYWKAVNIHLDEIAERSNIKKAPVCISGILRDECLKLINAS